MNPIFWAGNIVILFWRNFIFPDKEMPLRSQRNKLLRVGKPNRTSDQQTLALLHARATRALQEGRRGSGDIRNGHRLFPASPQL